MIIEIIVFELADLDSVLILLYVLFLKLCLTILCCFCLIVLFSLELLKWFANSLPQKTVCTPGLKHPRGVCTFDLMLFI